MSSHLIGMFNNPETCPDLTVIIEDETSKVEYARYDVHKSHMRFASAFLSDYLTEYPDLELLKLTVPNESYVNAARDLLMSVYGEEVKFTKELVELVMKYQFKRCARDICVVGLNHYYYDEAIVKLEKLNMLCMMASGESLWTLEDGEFKRAQEDTLDSFYEDYAYRTSWEDGKVVDYLCKELSFRSLYDFLKKKDDGKSCMDGDAVLVAKWYEYHKTDRTGMVDMMKLIDVFRLTPSYRSWWVDYIMLIDETYFRGVIKDVARGRKNDIDVWKGEHIFTLSGKDLDYCCLDVTAEKYMPNCTFEYAGDDAYLSACFVGTNDRLTTTFNHEITVDCTIIMKLNLMSFDKKHIYASYRGVKGCDGIDDVSFELGWDLKSIGLKDDETYVLICGYDFVYNV